MSFDVRISNTMWTGYCASRVVKGVVMGLHRAHHRLIKYAGTSTFCDEETRRRELTESSAGCNMSPCCGCIRSKATCKWRVKRECSWSRYVLQRLRLHENLQLSSDSTLNDASRGQEQRSQGKAPSEAILPVTVSPSGATTWRQRSIYQGHNAIDSP